MKGGGVFKEYSLDDQTALLEKISNVYVEKTQDFVKDRKKSFMEFVCEINKTTRDKKLKEEINKFYNTEEEEEIERTHLASDEDMMYNVRSKIQYENQEFIFNAIFKIFKEQNKIVSLDESIILVDKNIDQDIEDFKTNGKVDLQKYVESKTGGRTVEGYRGIYRTEWTAALEYWRKLKKLPELPSKSKKKVTIIDKIIKGEYKRLGQKKYNRNKKKQTKKKHNKNKHKKKKTKSSE